MRPEILLETVDTAESEEQRVVNADTVEQPSRSESLVVSLLDNVLDDMVDHSRPLSDGKDDNNVEPFAPDQLRIIDDHFGGDQREGTATPVPPSPHLEHSPHLSDISESELMPLAEDVDLPAPETAVRIATSTPAPEAANDQRQELTDLLLYRVDSDPLLRGNAVHLIGCFCDATLRLRRQSIEQLSGGRVSLDQLLRAIFDGLNDESHIVVKHALIAVERLLAQLLRWATPMRFEAPRGDDDLAAAVVKNVVNSESEVHVVEWVLDRVCAVFANKYWVVQCRYCELIGSMQFDEVEWQLDGDKRHVIEVSIFYFVYHL